MSKEPVLVLHFYIKVGDTRSIVRTIVHNTVLLTYLLKQRFSWYSEYNSQVIPSTTHDISFLLMAWVVALPKKTNKNECENCLWRQQHHLILWPNGYAAGKKEKKIPLRTLLPLPHSHCSCVLLPPLQKREEEEEPSLSSLSSFCFMCLSRCDFYAFLEKEGKEEFSEVHWSPR